MTDGIILIDKPSHMTSFGVVARLKRVLSEQAGKKVKVGHTGTLDPFATGLMIVVIGAECKNAAAYSKLDKSYEATIILGATSSTGDPEGEIIARENVVIPTRNEIEKVLPEFIGEITQVPPIYSAIKINGVRAYKLARNGDEVDMPERNVTVFSLELLSYDYPQLHVRTHVSSGTYIRTLAADIGERLTTGAYTVELRRLSVGKYSVTDARSLFEYGIIS